MSPLAPPPLAQSKPSWFRRNWWCFIPGGVMVFFGFFAVFVGVIIFFVFGLIKNSGSYEIALAAAKQDQRVIERLGTPVEDGWYVSGNINTSGPSGEADLAIPISGPLGKATLYVVASKSAGQWTLSVLDCEFKDSGERIFIPTESLPPPG